MKFRPRKDIVHIVQNLDYIKNLILFSKKANSNFKKDTLDCLIQALVRIAILLYLIPFKWCEYKTPCSPLKKHGANRRHGVLNRKKPILISLAWCTFFKNTGGNIKQNFDMLYQFQKNGVNIRHDVLFQKLMVLLKGMMYFFKKYWCE